MRSALLLCFFQARCSSHSLLSRAGITEDRGGPEIAAVGKEVSGPKDSDLYQTKLLVVLLSETFLFPH